MESSQPSQVRKNHLMRNLTLLTLGLLALIGIPGYIFTARNYVSQHAFTSRDSQPIKVTTARNESVALGIEINDGIDGYWASYNGLELRLEGMDTPLTVIWPKERGWGETISTKSKNISEPYYAIGTVTIPDSIGGSEQRSLKGRLSGNIVYPSGGILFSDKIVIVDVPVEIQLLPQSSFLWSGGRIFFEIFGWLNVVLGSLLLLLAGAALVQAIAVRRRVHARAPVTFGQTLKDGAMGVGSMIFVLIVLVPSLIGGLSVLSASGPAPDGTTTTILLPSILIGLAAAVSVLALFVKPGRKPQ